MTEITVVETPSTELEMPPPEVVEEVIEPIVEASVEIAQIEAEKEIALAEIHSETRLAEAEILSDKIESDERWTGLALKVDQLSEQVTLLSSQFSEFLLAATTSPRVIVEETTEPVVEELEVMQESPVESEEPAPRSVVRLV